MGATARVTRGAVCLLFFLVVMTLLGSEVFAATLQGTIYGGGQPIASAKVTLVNAGTLANVATATSDTAGAFSFAVGDGTYNLSIVAPTGSGYGDSVINGIAVAGSDVTQNVVLIKQGYKFTGVLRNPAGVPVSNIKITIIDEVTGIEAAEQKSDSAGAFSFPLSAGKYRVHLQGGARSGVGVPSVPAPQYFQMYPALAGIVVTGDVVRDITIPFVTLTGRTVDASGNAVAGVRITSLESFGGQSVYLYSNNDLYPYIYSDGSGNYSITMLAYEGNRLTLIPPGGKGLAQTTLKVGTIANETRDLTLPEGILLSGVVRNPAGKGASNIEITVVDDVSGASAGSAVTDATGSYSLSVLPGTYSLTAEGGFRSSFGPSSVPTPQYFNISGMAKLAVSAPTVRDLTLPLATISGRTVDVNGLAVAGVKLSSNRASWTTAGISASWDNGYTPNIQSDSSGSYLLTILAPATVPVTLIPPPAAGVAQTSVTLTAAADLTKDLVLPAAIYLSGVVRGPTGQPASNIRISAVDVATGLEAGEQKTDSAGAYSFPLTSGKYTLSIDGGYRFQGVSTVATPQYFSIYPYTLPIPVTGTMKKDLVLPFVTLAGKVTDGNGVGIGGVSITSAASWLEGNSSYACYNEYTPYVSSDPSGKYALTLLRGSDQSETIIPPTGSGFVQTSIESFPVTKNILQNIVLALPDSKDPVIVSGPAVSSVSDSSAVVEWQTDEPTNGGGTFGITDPPVSVIAETGFRTDHSITLPGLTADTLYYVSVFASDRAGNGPVTSRVVSFRTKRVPDTKAPVFVEGPIVTSVTHTGAAVVWKTDEPTTGTVTYSLPGGQSVEIADNTLAVEHRVELASLLPKTGYSFNVSALDAIGNGPVTASGGFTTLAAPDAAAPVIVEGPMVTDVTDTMATVVWRTDEPATSGVSYNDGTVYGMVKDDTLVTEHSVRLTGLTPSTLYKCTVASKDAAGNGPALGAERSFTTKAAADTRPPAIIEAPMVINITHQSAVIRWETDEPATCSVEYGTTNALGETVSRGELRQQHTVPVVGLEENTLYYFRVSCLDAAGNGPAVTSISSFTTDALPDTKKPVLTKEPEVVRQTDTTVTLEWQTDEPADSLVEYGEGETIGNQRSDGEKVTGHRVTLGNLAPGTTYRFVVSSTDMNGNRASAGLRPSASPARAAARAAYIAASPDAEARFSTGTSPDVVAPVITAGPTVQSVTDTRAVIGWTTDELSDSVVSYGAAGGSLDSSAADPKHALEHVVVLTNLVPGTTYSYRVSSTDPSWNGPVSSSLLTFTTGSQPDATAPAFTTLPAAIKVTDASAVISWVTNEPSTGEVIFGTAPDKLVYHASDSGLLTSHSVTLTNLEQNGTYYFAAVATDTSGNARQSDTGEFVAAGPVADTTGPSGTVTINGGAAGTTSRSVTLALTCSDASGCESMRLSNDGSTWTEPEAFAATKAWELTAADGKKTVFARFSDGTGNWSFPVTDSIVQDATPPRAIVQVIGGLVSPTRAKTITFGVDKGDVVTYRYRLDSGSWSADIAATATTTLSALADGTRKLEVIGKDAAGNWQSAASATALSWMVDSIAPVTIATPKGGTYTEAQTVTLAAGETATIYYTLNGTLPTAASARYSGPITVPLKGMLKFFAIDPAGNAETVKTETYGAPPVAVINGLPTVTKYQTASFTVRGADVTAFKYRLDGGTWSAELPLTTRINLSALGSGTHSVEVLAKNAGGVWQPADIPTVVEWTVDLTLPVVTASPQGGLYNMPQQVTLTASETATIYYTMNGTTPTVLSPKYAAPIAVPPGTVLKFIAADPAGNLGAVVTETYAAPVKSLVTGVPAAVTRATTATLTVGGSSVSAYRYALDGGDYGAEAPVATRIALTALAEGVHTLSVVGRKGTGEWQPTGMATTVSWIVDHTLPVTTVSPEGGSYTEPVTVTMTASEPANIFYTTDGSTPSIASRKYSGPISLPATATLKYFAIDRAGNSEGVKAQTYALPPVVILSGAPPTVTKATTISVGVSGATVTAYRYSLDGSGLSSETPVGTRITASALSSGEHTLSVIGRNSSGVWQNSPTVVTWTVDSSVPTVSASPAGGTYPTTQIVTLSASESATIYYTLNGQVPTQVSQKYSGPLAITPPATLKFIAVDAAGNASAATTEQYAAPLKAVLLQKPAVRTKLTGATFTVSGAGIVLYRYSLDGGEFSAPTVASMRIVLAGLQEGEHSITVLGGNSAGVWQPEEFPTTYTWTVDVTPPTVTASPGAGTISSAAIVELAASEKATIYYTLTGSAPTTSSTRYSVPITVAPGKTLKFIAVDEAGNASTVKTEAYPAEVRATISGIPAAPSKYGSVSVVVGGNGVTAFRYSLDGGPQSGIMVATTRLNLTGLAVGDHTLAVVGRNAAGTWQTTATTATWTVEQTPPVTKAEPAGGTYDLPQVVTLTANEDGMIYYTTNGSLPGYASPRYGGPIGITTTTTLSFFAVDMAGNVELVKKETYVIPPVALVSGVPSGTTTATSVTFAVSGDNVMIYKFRLDDGEWSSEIPAGSGRTLAGLAKGGHSLAIAGKNAAGTWQTTPTAVTWTVQ